MATEYPNPLPGQEPAIHFQGETNQALAEDDAQGPPSLMRELLWFLQDNKKWWLIPLIAMFALLGLLLLAGANPALAPFIYPIFW